MVTDLQIRLLGLQQWGIALLLCAIDVGRRLFPDGRAPDWGLVNKDWRLMLLVRQVGHE